MLKQPTLFQTNQQPSSMATYQSKFDTGDQFVYDGRFQTVMDKREDGDTVEYLLSLNGRKRWKDAAVIDRDARPHNTKAIQHFD